MKWKCKECDSEALEQLAWININTEKLNDYQDSATIWCCLCGAEDSAVEVDPPSHCKSCDVFAGLNDNGICYDCNVEGEQ